MDSLLSFIALLTLCLGHLTCAAAQCPDYSEYSKTPHPPLSSGVYQLGFMRPEKPCRSFYSSEVEDLILAVKSFITDPDLSRLFENTFPNTLDTAVKWHGFAANNTAEELTFLITGDINAMWLRDSANQLLSYFPVLRPSSDSNTLASLYRGAINLQARYLLTAPFCNSFHPPPEAGLNVTQNEGAAKDTVYPPYNTSAVWECKYELDSLAAFLSLSAAYAIATEDYAFFIRFQWLDAIQAVINTARQMMVGTYGEDGAVLHSPYTFTRETTRATETLANDGAGSPVAGGTGLVRSAFRPSDDACTLQLLIPANMMFVVGLAQCADIVGRLEELGEDVKVREVARELKSIMAGMAVGMRDGIEQHGILEDTVSGERVYAYEIDGFGSAMVMDDANIPSLLAAPLVGYLERNDTVYQSTRAVVLGDVGVERNPYYMRGPVFSAVGGPHNGPGFGWPMASIVRILTSDDDEEIAKELGQLVSTTDGLGLMHESINSFNQSEWTRQWFSWANGLFGQMIVDLRARKPGLLKRNYQNLA